MLVIKYLHWPSLGETLDRFSSVDKFKFKQNICTIYTSPYPVSNISPFIGKFFQTLIINMTLEVFEQSFSAHISDSIHFNTFEILFAILYNLLVYIFAITTWTGIFFLTNICKWYFAV